MLQEGPAGKLLIFFLLYKLHSSCSQFHWTDDTLSDRESETIFLNSVDANAVSAANLVRMTYGSITAPLSSLPLNGSVRAPSEVLEFHTIAYYHTVAFLDSLRRERTTSSKSLSNFERCVRARCECYQGPVRWRDAVSSPALNRHQG